MTETDGNIATKHDRGMVASDRCIRVRSPEESLLLDSALNITAS